MDREEMIRTLTSEVVANGRRWPAHSLNAIVADVLEAIDATFGEGWFIGTPTDRRVLEAAAEWSIRHPFADGIATPTDYLLRAVWARRVALNGTAAAP